MIQRNQKSKLYSMTATAIFAAVMAVIAPFALFLGPIPVSLCTLLIYVSGYLLGWKQGSMAALLYILMGMVGLPVFSGFTGGAGKLLGPTGGYIIGYLAVAVCTGWAVETFPKRRSIHLAGMLAGTFLLYVLGTVWYCIQAGQTFGAAISLCVLPFLPGDLLKMAGALVVGPLLRERLRKANLI